MERSEGEHRAAKRSADQPEPQRKRPSDLTASQRDNTEARSAREQGHKAGAQGKAHGGGRRPPDGFSRSRRTYGPSRRARSVTTEKRGEAGCKRAKTGAQRNGQRGRSPRRTFCEVVRLRTFASSPLRSVTPRSAERGSRGGFSVNVVGIVAEYNPFHTGHAFHLAETRRRLGECTAVVVMSGHFVQRGECAVFDKWTRARAALEGGADLVLELPTVWAAASAERFAWGAVNILREAGADALSFGSESGDEHGLREVAACLDRTEFHAGLRRFLDRGLPFAACRQAAVRELMGEAPAALLSGPNDNLGVEYLKAARRLGWEPEAVAIPRRGAGHDGGCHPDHPSASWLRERIVSGELEAENPADMMTGQRWMLAALRRMDESGFAALPDCGEGLSHRFFRAARQGRTLDEVYALVKTRRYAHARIRRAALWGALGLTERDRPDAPPYLRVLGAGERGRALLRELKKTARLPVITKPAHARKLDGPGQRLFELEARCTDLYQLCRKTPGPCALEWTSGPVML